MNFGSKQRLKFVENIPIYINGDEIERVKEFKYLGVYLDENSTLETHSKYIYNKASSRLLAIRKIRERIDQSTALCLYMSLVLPHFDYCDTIYMTGTINLVRLFADSECMDLCN